MYIPINAAVWPTGRPGGQASSGLFLFETGPVPRELGAISDQESLATVRLILVDPAYLMVPNHSLSVPFIVIRR